MSLSCSFALGHCGGCCCSKQGNSRWHMLQERWPCHVILRSSIMYGPQSAVPVSRTLFLQFVSSALSQGEQAARQPPVFCWDCILKSVATRPWTEVWPVLSQHSALCLLHCAHAYILCSAAFSAPEPAQAASLCQPETVMLAQVQCLHCAAGKSATFFSDEFRCPIYVQDIVQILQLIVERSSEGLPNKLYNLGGEERLSR